jgi:hypothetical protein
MWYYMVFTAISGANQLRCLNARFIQTNTKLDFVHARLTMMALQIPVMRGLKA